MPSRQEAVQQIAALVAVAKSNLDFAQKLSDEHGLAFQFEYNDNTRARSYNGWDDSGCTIDEPYGGWDASSEVCW